MVSRAYGLARIFLPFSAVVAGITTFIIANTDPDDLVVGDYYKKAKRLT